MISSPNHSSKEWLFSQYDNMVMCDTIYSSGESDAAVVRIHNSKKQLLFPVTATLFIVVQIQNLVLA